MKIGGLQKTSLLDYPNHISAIIWTIGCNFRCPFCYNIELVEGTAKLFPESEILEFLSTRKGLLEAVVITGGEPFLQHDLESFLKKIKSMDFLIKIDTNGTNPAYLKKVLEQNLVDYIAMDVKAPLRKYLQVTGSDVTGELIAESIKIIQNDAPTYEFRTTIVPGLLTKEDIIEIARWLKGSKQYYLQQFKQNANHLDPQFNKKKPMSKEEIKEIFNLISSNFDKCGIRGIK